MSLDEASRNEPWKLTIIWGQFHGFREVAQNHTTKSVQSSVLKIYLQGLWDQPNILQTFKMRFPRRANFLTLLPHLYVFFNIPQR